jgi:hypothetical protein
LGKVLGWLYQLGKWVNFFLALLPPRLLGLVGSLAVSQPVWLSLYLLVVKELTAPITGSHVFYFLSQAKKMDYLSEVVTEVLNL